jgi:hypothetical protein
MRVERLNSSGIAPARRRDKAGGAKSGGFASALGGGSEAATQVAGAAPVSAVGGILAAQEVNDPTTGKSRGLKRGHDILDRLEEMHRALVVGTLNLTQVERLANFVAARKENVADPALAELLNEIEIRAAVELAKFGR